MPFVCKTNAVMNVLCCFVSFFLLLRPHQKSAPQSCTKVNKLSVPPVCFLQVRTCPFHRRKWSRMWAGPRISPSPVRSPSNPAWSRSSRWHGSSRKTQKPKGSPYLEPTGTPLYKCLGGVISWDSVTLCPNSSISQSWSLVLKIVECISARWRSGFPRCRTVGGRSRWKGPDILLLTSMQEVRSILFSFLFPASISSNNVCTKLMCLFFPFQEMRKPA